MFQGARTDLAGLAFAAALSPGTKAGVFYWVHFGEGDSVGVRAMAEGESDPSLE